MWDDRSAMFPVSHFDLMVLITVAACIHFGGLLLMAWLVFQGHGMVKEAQRLTRAVGALVIQEEEKTRDLFRA